MDNKATTKRMIGAVVLVLVAALLLAWLLKGKNKDGQQNLAQNNAAEVAPIKGFPVAGPDDKPQLVGEGDAAQQAQDTAAQQATNTAEQAADGNSLMPNIQMPQTAQNTTGFDVRPNAGEQRQIVDTDGQVKAGEGNLGTGDAKPAQQQQAAANNTNASQQDKPAENKSAADKPAQQQAQATTQQEKPAENKPAAPKAVLVNEKPVARPQSVESAEKKAAAEKVAKEKAEEERIAREKAEKAAEAKSKELAGGSATAAAKGEYAIQVVATSSKSKADGIAAPIRADGYTVAVQEAPSNGKTIYRVKVTGFGDRAAAVTAQAKMKARYTQNTHVQNSFVTGK